jgi:hypothetical protein
MFKEQGPPKGPPPKAFKLKSCGAEQDEEDCPMEETMLNIYLKFLQEREWNDKNIEWDNDELETIKHFLSNLDRKSTDKMDANRHSFQPSIFNIYLKNVIGDYKGRIDALNSRRVYTVGIKALKKHIPDLIKRKKKAMSISIVPKKDKDDLLNLKYRDNQKHLDKGAPIQ